MKPTIAVILLGVVAGTLGQGILGPDWTKNLLKSIDQLNSNIQRNVQSVTREIQSTVQGHLEHIDRLNEDMARQIGKAKQQATKLGNGGSTIFINGSGGVSRTIFSGQGSNGETYFRDSEDRIVGDILHHTDRIYNPATKTMDEYKYTLDLKDPNAKPIPV